MAIDTYVGMPSPRGLRGALLGLQAGESSAVAIANAPYTLETRGPITQMALPWIEGSGLYVPDRLTELAGSANFPDMPPHVDPHPLDSLKVNVVDQGSAVVRFVPKVPREFLDEVNELPASDYTPLAEAGITPDEYRQATGTAVLFLGSSTMHQFISVGQREAYVNSYAPAQPS